MEREEINSVNAVELRKAADRQGRLEVLPEWLQLTESEAEALVELNEPFRNRFKKS